jgi:UDP-N-acetyl-D-glucosamine dehydrogenase
MKDPMLKKIKSKEAIIGIVGLGYVGLPLMLRFTESGFCVLGFDIDAAKVDMLSKDKRNRYRQKFANVGKA